MGHFIIFFLFIICLIPGIDKWHSLMLFWLRPKDQIQEPVYSSIERSKRRKVVAMYGFLLISLFTAFLGLVVAPAIIKPQLKFKIPLLM